MLQIDSPDDDGPELPNTDAYPLPCRAVVESWFRAESGRVSPPLEELLTLYLQNELPRDYRGRIEERLATDPWLRARLDELAREEIDDEEQDVEGESARYERGANGARLKCQLESRGIQIPDERVWRRSGTSGWFAFRRRHEVPFGAREFVPRLLDELGTPSAAELVDQAFRMVAAAGEPDSWIREVGRARRRGVLSSEVGYFLVWQFAASAIQRVSETHPVLSKLSARIERIEGQYDDVELETWRNRAGPPKWETLCQEWDMAREALIRHILERNEEYEAIQESLRDQTPYREGRFYVYGV